MNCTRCGSQLERPGDYCLVCHTSNADVVVLELGRERATITALEDDGSVVSERVVTTTPETDGEQVRSELRSFAGQIAAAVRRKRPTEVSVTGDRDVLQAVRTQLRFPLSRVESDNPVEHVIERQGEPALETVEQSVEETLGGSHSTIIGGRTGRDVLGVVAAHPHVKKIIPGPIDSGGSGTQSGLRAKATRADDNGNVRLLIREGSSVQENRIITTAGDHSLGERIREDLNESLTEAGFE